MKKQYFVYMLSAAMFFAGGCDDFGDTNVSPNQTTTPLTSALLTNVLANTPATGATVGLYCQYYSQTQYTDASLYTTFDLNWGGELAGDLNDIQKIINLNTDDATKVLTSLEGSNNNQLAIARILRAYRYSVLTDRYGDMPYSQALSGNTQPVFDKQEDIYKDLFKELAEAVDQFGGKDKMKGDIMFDPKGSASVDQQTASWRKFANSLRIILALRISYKDEAKARAEYAKALAAKGGIFTSNADNFGFANYPGGAFKNAFFGLASDWSVSNTVADMMNTMNDARKAAFGKPSGTTLIGVPYGLKREDAVKFIDANTGKWSLILNDDWRKETSGAYFLTYSQLLLARAEAAQRGWTEEATSAATLYSDGIKASWEQWKVYSASAFTTYMARTDVSLATNALQKIGTQRWLSHFPDGNQGWYEWRRTGFPALTPTINAVNNSKQIPRRLIFPSFEYNINGANTLAAAARIGGDLVDTKVWWDAK